MEYEIVKVGDIVLYVVAIVVSVIKYCSFCLVDLWREGLVLVVMVGFHFCDGAMVVRSRRVDDYGSIVNVKSVVRVTIYSVVVWCAGCRIMRSNVVVCRVIISVILVIGVVIYNIVIQPACDFKYCGIAACRNA